LPLLVLARDGTLIEANEAALASDVVPQFETPHGDEVARFLDGLRSRGEAEARIGFGVMTGRAIDDAFVVWCDPTRNTEVEEELRQLRSGASLALVAASLVHDFNNMLTPVLVLSSRLTHEIEPSSPGALLATEIHSAATLAASLMRDVLSLARTQTAPHVERVDVNDVIVARRRLLERLVGEDVRIELDLTWDISEIVVDRGRLEHALLNLVANARDAMPDGGTLTIATRMDHDSTRVALSVTDTGMGMTDEVRRRAFESFFTTKSATGGVGIGLASVQRFARDNGGSVALDSAVAKGTTASLLLPRAPALDEPPSEPKAETPSDEAPASRTVLVADRDPRIRRVVRLALEPRGYAVTDAASCESAVEIATSRLVSVALVDARLPCRDPRTFVHRLRAASPDIRVIFLADRSPPRHPSETPARVLPKPFSEEDLVRAVRNACA